MIGKTGDFPNGKLQEDDEGGLRMMVETDTEKNVIRLVFGTFVAWFAFPKSEAEILIKILQERIKELKD
jgi:hypothetical protein